MRRESGGNVKKENSFIFSDMGEARTKSTFTLMWSQSEIFSRQDDPNQQAMAAAA